MTAMTAHLSRLLGYLHHDPDNKRLLADIADAQIRLGRTAEARAVLERILTLHPQDPQARYGLAVVDLAQDRKDDALHALHTLMEEGHRSPAIRWQLARALALCGRWSEARDALSEPSLDELPAELLDDWALMQVRALHHCSAVDAAINQIQLWHILCGERGLPLPGRAALATLLLDNNQPEQAAALVAQCDTMEIESSAGLSSAAGYLALAAGNGPQALHWFRHSQRLQPSDGRASLGEGLAAALMGQPDKAVQAIRAATQANPSHLGSWHALAWMQLLGQDLAGAEASFQAAMAQDDTFGESHGGMALIQVLKGRADDARSLLRTAVKLDPQGFNAMAAQWMLAHDESALSPSVLVRLQQAFKAQASKVDPALGLLLQRWNPQ